ncbi:6-hydroxy-D-nicotine oxidase [Ophiocordyceps camponoti-floridani]|uniref:6-hydroxy-D-nicotine oxidase n=1 Tax=Ophiocordyceps camponoti-floridani TaxID=2030778 RepID=A0A8H4Q341_9HYPO|nr:6-hydroxy-D-nicotine oxidase [Ophiocordyceps camponoti-floridani]
MATVCVAILLALMTTASVLSADPVMPGTVSLPDSPEYRTANTYWSTRQSRVHPRCFVAPTSTSQVSETIRILSSLRTPFSVKSGGHAAFENGSNTPNGITIDLVNLNDIIVSPGRQTVSIGPGNRWINVSRALDPHGLAVVGGRAADVGVSGLILGGGISYFSGSRGWACDNVRNYEVVVSSGRIVQASPSVNPDLYWALRGGGGSNFGIVTRFDVEAFPQGDLWTSSISFPASLNQTVVSLFQELSSRGFEQDPLAHFYFVMTYESRSDDFLILTSFFHPDPPADGAIPPVFLPFHSTPGGTPLANGTRRASVSALSMAIDQPSGSRQTWWDTSVDVSSAKLFQDIVSLFEAFVKDFAVRAANTELTPYLIFQPISPSVINAMQKNGGNALGLIPEDGPLMIVQLAVSWSDEQLDSYVEKSSAALIEQIDELSRQGSLFRGFRYMNYAGRDQNVFASYGNRSLGRLKAIAERWDPDGVFRDLWKGYFKL